MSFNGPPKPEKNDAEVDESFANLGHEATNIANASEAAEQPDEAAQEVATPAVSAEQSQAAAEDAQNLAAVKERLGMAAAPEAAHEDPLAKLTPEDYKNAFRYLKEGVDYPNYLAAYQKGGSEAVVQGKTVREWMAMNNEHVDKSDQLRNALYDRAIDGSITDEQKHILADYLVSHQVIKDSTGPMDINRSSSQWGPRWKDLWGSGQAMEIIKLANPRAAERIAAYNAAHPNG